MSSDSEAAPAPDPQLEEPDGKTTLVDARCCGCKEVSVYRLPGDPGEWEPGNTFFDHCRVCSEETPTNVIALLWGFMEGERV